MKRIEVSDLRTLSGELLAHIAGGERVILGNGVVEVALVSLDDLKFLEATDEALDEQHAAEARRILNDPDEGRTVPFSRESETPAPT